MNNNNNDDDDNDKGTSWFLNIYFCFCSQSEQPSPASSSSSSGFAPTHHKRQGKSLVYTQATAVDAFVVEFSARNYPTKILFNLTTWQNKSLLNLQYFTSTSFS